jgi:hypothetical protein
VEAVEEILLPQEIIQVFRLLHQQVVEKEMFITILVEFQVAQVEVEVLTPVLLEETEMFHLYLHLKVNQVV